MSHIYLSTPPTFSFQLYSPFGIRPYPEFKADLEIELNAQGNESYHLNSRDYGSFKAGVVFHQPSGFIIFRDEPSILKYLEVAEDPVQIGEIRKALIFHRKIKQDQSHAIVHTFSLTIDKHGFYGLKEVKGD